MTHNEQPTSNFLLAFCYNIFCFTCQLRNGKVVIKKVNNWLWKRWVSFSWEGKVDEGKSFKIKGFIIVKEHIWIITFRIKLSPEYIFIFYCWLFLNLLLLLLLFNKKSTLSSIRLPCENFACEWNTIILQRENSSIFVQ